MNAEQRELWERIEKVRPAMMTTAESDGSFRSRPLLASGDGCEQIFQRIARTNSIAHSAETHANSHENITPHEPVSLYGR